MHKCDNPICINHEHMKIGTIKENNQDMARKGRAARMFGEDNPVSKLNEDDVYYIREVLEDTLYDQDLPKIRKELSDKFDVTPACIYNVETRATWNHLK